MLIFVLRRQFYYTNIFYNTLKSCPSRIKCIDFNCFPNQIHIHLFQIQNEMTRSHCDVRITDKSGFYLRERRLFFRQYHSSIHKTPTPACGRWGGMTDKRAITELRLFQIEWKSNGNQKTQEM